MKRSSFMGQPGSEHTPRSSTIEVRRWRSSMPPLAGEHRRRSNEKRKDPLFFFEDLDDDEGFRLAPPSPDAWGLRDAMLRAELLGDAIGVVAIDPTVLTAALTARALIRHPLAAQVNVFANAIIHVLPLVVELAIEGKAAIT